MFWEQVLHRSDIQVKDAEGRPRSVHFFDATTAANNDFHVVDQYVGKNADGDQYRPDLLLFVNGLPLAIIECKASHHRLDEALSQLDEYQASFPAQFVFNQVCVGLNRREGCMEPFGQSLRSFPATAWKLMNWRPWQIGRAHV